MVIIYIVRIGYPYTVPHGKLPISTSRRSLYSSDNTWLFSMTNIILEKTDEELLFYRNYLMIYGNRGIDRPVNCYLQGYATVRWNLGLKRYVFISLSSGNSY